MLRGSMLSVILLTPGCAASMSADAQMNAELDGRSIPKGEASADFSDLDRPLTKKQLAGAQNTAFLEEASATPEPVLFGARHDFTVKDASGAVPCGCVSVLLGLSTSGKLSWRGDIPRIKPETQLVIGLIPDTGDCGGAPKGSGGASYWGYRVVGNDVVVLLEEWNPSLPRTLGAIIPKPPSGGQVYVAPVNSKGTGQGGRCAAGNPGAMRTEPISPGGPSSAGESETTETSGDN